MNFMNILKDDSNNSPSYTMLRTEKSTGRSSESSTSSCFNSSDHTAALSNLGIPLSVSMSMGFAIGFLKG